MNLLRKTTLALFLIALLLALYVSPCLISIARITFAPISDFQIPMTNCAQVELPDTFEPGTTYKQMIRDIPLKNGSWSACELSDDTAKQAEAVQRTLIDAGYKPLYACETCLVREREIILLQRVQLEDGKTYYAAGQYSLPRMRALKTELNHCKTLSSIFYR